MFSILLEQCALDNSDLAVLDKQLKWPGALNIVVMFGQMEFRLCGTSAMWDPTLVHCHHSADKNTQTHAHIADFCRSNRLRPNPEKRRQMVFSAPSWWFLQRVHDIKIGSIVTESHLSFHKHVEITFISSCFAILRQLRSVCSEPIWCNIFKASIVSLFASCAPVFPRLQKTHDHRVQSILIRGEHIYRSNTTHAI